jgi:hypothetical protein
MPAFLQVSTAANLGYLSVAAGFLIIVASVVFVIKGKAVLSDSGAPNALEWGKIKANFTSAVALFVLGAVMIVLPYRSEVARESLQPPTAIITGKVGGTKDVRLLLVVKPDYDQTYRGDIVWQVPLVDTRASYSIIYIDGDTILGQQPFSVNSANPGSAQQKVTLPEWDLQTASAAATQIDPKLEVSDAKLKSLGIR